MGMYLCSFPSHSEVVEANMNGEMNLKIETDLVSVTTHFKDLGNPPWGELLIHAQSIQPLIIIIY